MDATKIKITRINGKICCISLITLVSTGKRIEQVLTKHLLVHETDAIEINAVENKQADLCVLKRRFLKGRQKRHRLSLISFHLSYAVNAAY